MKFNKACGSAREKERAHKDICVRVCEEKVSIKKSENKNKRDDKEKKEEESNRKIENTRVA